MLHLCQNGVRRSAGKKASLFESTGAGGGDGLVSLEMEVMKLGRQLRRCQGGTARVTANVQ